MPEVAIAVEGLRIETVGGTEIVDDVGFVVARGECLALVGESGCGKTSTALALLGHARAGTRIAAGTVQIGAHELIGMREEQRRRLRGALVSYVPQDPTTALDPRQRVGDQVAEVLQAHGGSRRSTASATAALVARVGLPADAGFLRRYPFELSGGQQQRLTIAMALIADPAVVVLDEPTTGLDAATQAHVLDLLRELGRDRDVAFVYVTHDLAVVDGLADRVAVMYAGRVVEEGTKEQLFVRASHPYTALLLESVPRLSFRHELHGIPGTAPAPARRPPACRFAPRCPLAIEVCHVQEPPRARTQDGRWVRCHRAFEAMREVDRRTVLPPARPAGATLLEVRDLHASYGRHRGEGAAFALSDVSLTVSPGECVALVGESGSGKSTLGRCIVGLHRPDAGTITLGGQPLAPHASQRSERECHQVQFVFQNPDRSLNPARTVEQILSRPLRRLAHVPADGVGDRVEQLLDRVRLPASAARRYPRELSGGEKQRVAIARALAAEPLLLICDEITSALDVSIQAAIVALLGELRTTGLALLFITHNLALVNSIADGVIVLEGGHIREEGRTPEVLGAPRDPYTQALLAAVPELRSDLAGQLPSVPT